MTPVYYGIPSPDEFVGNENAHEEELEVDPQTFPFMRRSSDRDADESFSDDDSATVSSSDSVYLVEDGEPDNLPYNHQHPDNCDEDNCTFCRIARIEANVLQFNAELQRLTRQFHILFPSDGDGADASAASSTGADASDADANNADVSDAGGADANGTDTDATDADGTDEPGTSQISSETTTAAASGNHTAAPEAESSSTDASSSSSPDATHPQTSWSSITKLLVSIITTFVSFYGMLVVWMLVITLIIKLVAKTGILGWVDILGIGGPAANTAGSYTGSGLGYSLSYPGHQLPSTEGFEASESSEEEVAEESESSGSSEEEPVTKPDAGTPTSLN
ncbi:hypothetical protein Dda_2539 [Drechslerella dactyloides]|uniref:Uncharacterized protein n=1 Tax=Drechslerella dactyloides TaxID=74499 RepID=A0AAD6IZS4_DREDA|nr:hypothetical protein Dda_2539 [Drechslerella dactyloides]